MTEDEFNLLAPVEDDYSKVLCKSCGKELPKRGVFTHIHKHHPEIFEDSWGWIVKRDYNMINNYKQRLDENSRFTKAWAKHATQQLLVEEQFGLEDGDPQTPQTEDVAPPTPQTAAPQPGSPQPASSQPAAAQPDEQPAPGELAIQLHGLEDRTLRWMDEIVGGFNQVLQVGLGQVQAKYPVALHDWLLEI